MGIVETIDQGCRAIIKTFQCFLRERLDPITIMSYISLPQPEREKIIKRTDNYGNHEGVDQLLDTIKCRCPTAFYELMRGLEQNHPDAFKTVYGGIEDLTIRENIKIKSVSLSAPKSDILSLEQKEKLNSLKVSVLLRIAEGLTKDGNWKKLLKKIDLSRKEATEIRKAEKPGEALLDTINEIPICEFVKYLIKARLDVVLSIFTMSDDLKKYLPSKDEQSLLSNEDPKTGTCDEIRPTDLEESSLEDDETKEQNAHSSSVIAQCEEDLLKDDSSQSSPTDDNIVAQGSDQESETGDSINASVQNEGIIQQDATSGESDQGSDQESETGDSINASVQNEGITQQDATRGESLPSNQTVNLDDAGHSISVLDQEAGAVNADIQNEGSPQYDVTRESLASNITVNLDDATGQSISVNPE